MKRRPFVTAAAALLGWLLAGPARRLADTRPGLAARAWIARRAPGRVAPPDPDRLRRPGPWAG